MMDFETYERLLAKADAEGIEIVGYDVTSHGVVFFVKNPAHEGVYTVRIENGSRIPRCACPAGQFGVPCKHEARVYEHLLTKQPGTIEFPKITEAVYG